MERKTKFILEFILFLKFILFLQNMRTAEVIKQGESQFNRISKLKRVIEYNKGIIGKYTKSY